MKEVVIHVPDGYLFKAGFWVVIILGVALVFPFYRSFLESVTARSVIVQAESLTEARRILNEGGVCK